ncbi:MAG: ferritin-like domain-containing protein [Microbacteriaceae bacterium]
MTETATTTKYSANPDVAAAAAQFLDPVVVDLTAVVVNGKQAHWHVRGDNFIGVHELLDQVVMHALAWADLAAERVVALGLPVDARLRTVATKTTTGELSAGFQQSKVAITQMVEQLDAALVTVRTAVKELEEIDVNSQDVVVEIERGLVYDRWQLFAHISE